MEGKEGRLAGMEGGKKSGKEEGEQGKREVGRSACWYARGGRFLCPAVAKC